MAAAAAQRRSSPMKTAVRTPALTRILARATWTAALSIGAAKPALAQPAIPPIAHEINLSGPRFGITALSGGVVDKLKSEDGISVRPIVSQFGWQFERQFFSGGSGPTAITEAVVLVGGLEQGLALPSVSW